MEENTFDFLLGEEKDAEVQVSCSLFLGDFYGIIGSLPKAEDMGIFKKSTKNNSSMLIDSKELFFVDFCTVIMRVIKINKK